MLFLIELIEVMPTLFLIELIEVLTASIVFDKVNGENVTKIMILVFSPFQFV